MNTSTNLSPLTSITPFFIVRDVVPALTFYQERLGFDVQFSAPDGEPFFAILQRDAVRIMIKAILPEVVPAPNHTRHRWARWDAFIHTPDPDALAGEFTSRGLSLHEPLGDTEDRLRGFEVKDLDGYVLFFGRPL